ncbi:hypothetical protein A5662_18035 [Mycobacteriaceae bacterium 1482268.1]|nr:hypothetical protein A5662_18035 [Mycobacteriaceae bacterium 1482268.1]
MAGDDEDAIALAVEAGFAAVFERLTGADAGIPISLAAYERAFEAKVRWEAGHFADADQLDFPTRYRVGDDGTLATRYELVPLPRTGTVYTETTVHIRVLGLRTPYSLVIVEQDGVGVRALVKATGVQPGTVGIGSDCGFALESDTAAAA